MARYWRGGVRPMRAQQLVAPHTFVDVEVPPPGASDLGEGDVLLRVLVGGICGSDLPAFRTAASGMPGFPLHEVVGEVLASRDPAHPVGERVVGWASRFDALAEQIVTRGADVAPFDPGLLAERAVILQPLACVLYAVEQLGDVRDCHVAVLGLGPIGLLFCHVLKAQGAGRVTGVDRVHRGDLAARFGVDEAVQAGTDRWAEHMSVTDRPDLIVEAIGHNAATLENAVQTCAAGGRIYHFGVPDDAAHQFDMRAFFRKNLTLIAGITLDRRRMLLRADKYLRRHPTLAPQYVTHTFGMDQAQRAFDLATDPQPGRVKIVLVGRGECVR